MKFCDEVKGKNVLVFGLGLQGGGLGDALWLISKGANVKITDLKTKEELTSSLAKLPTAIDLSLGGHRKEDIEWADLIIKNPGVPDNDEQIELARKLNKPVITSIAKVVEEGGSKIIGVTGTRGKSTTTELIFQLLSSVYPTQVEKGGNIPSTSGLSLLDQLDNLKYIVLELSSFQLHSFHDQHISPHIAIVTNMYPDHLNRYASMEAYFADKSSITSYQTRSDYVIYNQDNQYATKIAALSSGVKISFSASIVPKSWNINILGQHNLENISAVIKLAEVMKINIAQVKKMIENFHGLPYRLEKRRELNGVTYINDTTSTTPTSTIKALSAHKSPIILILGGDDKKLPYDDLLTVLGSASQLKGIVILGSAHLPDFVAKLHSTLSSKILAQVNSMKEAVQVAFDNAKSGDIVLLSPGFSSFDLFKNEFDRGNQFNECVARLS